LSLNSGGEAASNEHFLFDSMYAPSGNGEPVPDFAEFDASGGRWSDSDLSDGVTITYSYSNFLNGNLPGGTSVEDLIAATEEALGLWAANAPLHFQEIVDSGPPPSEAFYDPGSHPDIRIGHHLIDGPSSVLAHAYFPREGAGRAGDVHFDSGDSWTIGPSGGFDVVEVMLHELGHSLGLGHEPTSGETAIMNPFYGGRFSGLGTGFLFDDDIAGIQAIYGEGEGSVTPLQPLVVDIVDDESDDNFDEGDLSLREAIEQSLLAGGQQRVTFAETLAGQTIVLDSPLPVNGTLFIEGLGASQITVQASDPSAAAGDGFQIFQITDDDPDTITEVTITGLTLTGADSATNGGAIFNEESLTLDDVRIVDNSSAGKGGGVYSSGLVTITGSTLANNHADDDGGGVHTSGGISLIRSTVSGNSSGDEGGGISAEGEGTAIIVNSSTITGNSAVGSGGGMHVFDLNPTRLRVIHSTVVQNTSGNSGGGIYQYDGVLLLDHSIVASNTDAGTAPDVDNVNFLNNPVVIARYSLIGNNKGSDMDLFGGNIVGTQLSQVDPGIGPLQNNGGPTETHGLMTDSLALDSGNPSILAPPEFDQRGPGFDRIDGVIDIGAFESSGFMLNFVVDTLDDQMNGDLSIGNVSLREAIDAANLASGIDQIVFAPSLSGGKINLNALLGEILISDSVVIDAGGLDVALTIDGSSADASPLIPNGDGTRLFRIDDGDSGTLIDVTFSGLKLVGGDANGDGGAIRSVENLTLNEVSVLNNGAAGDGGGIYHKDGLLSLHNITLSNNFAADDGGGLFVNTHIEDPVGQLRQVTISGNSAGDEGGGIYNFDGSLTIEHSTITDNEASYGSGVVSYGDLTTETAVYSSIIAGNQGLDVSISRNLGHNSFVSLGYNLIGVGNGFLAFDNNDMSEVLDPQLGPLANNGGDQFTHLPLAGSAAIDASDPAFNPADPDGDPETDDALPNDQRQSPRLADGNNDTTPVLDIGAVEVAPPEPDADFNNDGLVGGFDFLLWQRGHGIDEGATSADGDSDADGDVDGDDVGNWESQFGDQGPVTSTSPPTEDALPQRRATRAASGDHVALAARQELFSQYQQGQSLRRGYKVTAEQPVVESIPRLQQRFESQRRDDSDFGSISNRLPNSRDDASFDAALAAIGPHDWRIFGGDDAK
ncbi:matrixin family metalloprotease, partial [Pirellulales bacterium]|nr:matrixin family metalloprotease [Pirellulales bacterium]